MCDNEKKDFVEEGVMENQMACSGTKRPEVLINEGNGRLLRPFPVGREVALMETMTETMYGMQKVLEDMRRMMSDERQGVIANIAYDPKEKSVPCGVGFDPRAALKEEPRKNTAPILAEVAGLNEALHNAREDLDLLLRNLDADVTYNSRGGIPVEADVKGYNAENEKLITDIIERTKLLLSMVLV